MAKSPGDKMTKGNSRAKKKNKDEKKDITVDRIKFEKEEKNKNDS